MLWEHLQHWIYKALSICVNFKNFKADFIWDNLNLVKLLYDLKDKCEQPTLNVCVNIYVNYSKKPQFSVSTGISIQIGYFHGNLGEGGCISYNKVELA